MEILLLWLMMLFLSVLFLHNLIITFYSVIQLAQVWSLCQLFLLVSCCKHPVDTGRCDTICDMWSRRVVDVLALPRLQARQQRAPSVHPQAAGPGPDDLPAQSLRLRPWCPRDLRERPCRQGTFTPNALISLPKQNSTGCPEWVELCSG